MINQTQRLLFNQLNIKGQIVQLHDSWQAMIQDRHYPPELVNLLGQVTLIAIMLANGLKHRGKIIIQIQGKGPVNLLVVEATDQLKIRGVAKTNQPLTQLKDANAPTSLDALLGDGKIMVTLDNEVTGKLFQSFVPREGTTLCECFEHYFTQSEQQPAKLWLATSEDAIGGVIIQKMPDADQKDSDGWNRIAHLSSTVQADELCTLNSAELLTRLFVEEDIQLYAADEVDYECPQERSKVEAMLKSLGQEEALKIIEEQGEIVVFNEICNFHERFTKADILKLFAQPLSD